MNPGLATAFDPGKSDLSVLLYEVEVVVAVAQGRPPYKEYVMLGPVERKHEDLNKQMASRVLGL